MERKLLEKRVAGRLRGTGKNSITDTCTFSISESVTSDKVGSEFILTKHLYLKECLFTTIRKSAMECDVLIIQILRQRVKF